MGQDASRTSRLIRPAVIAPRNVQYLLCIRAHLLRHWQEPDLFYASTNASHRSSSLSCRPAGTYVWRERLVGWTTARLCHLSQGRRVLDSIQPFLGWICYFLGSRCFGFMGEPLQGFMVIWNDLGIPFVVVGQYLIWGRFVYTAWLKRRTYYAVTNRRVVVVQEGWKRQVASAYIDSLPSLIKEGGSNGIGILRFGPAQSMWSNNRGWGTWNALNVSDQPAFVDIEDVDSVYRLVSDLRERSRTKPTS